MKRLEPTESLKKNEMVELPVEMQIKVIKNARKNYITNRYNTALCFNLDYTIKLLLDIGDVCGYGYIQNLIPIFTKENACNSVGIDSGCMAGYWWTIKNTKKRIEFLDWMVRQLENMANID